MGTKEHKYQFQSSSNQHERLSRFMLISYCAMLPLAAALIPFFGVLGLTVAWLAAELIQTAYVVRLNTELFPPEVKISAAPMFRLGAVLAVGFLLALWPSLAATHWPLGTIFLVASSLTALVLAGCYYAFDLRDVRSLILSKLGRRVAL
jgi:hypothetical protein